MKTLRSEPLRLFQLCRQVQPAGLIHWFALALAVVLVTGFDAEARTRKQTHRNAPADVAAPDLQPSTGKVGLGVQEREGRAADEVALAAKKRAISTLKLVARKPQNKSQETAVLLRLVETLQEAAAISFRLAHGRAAVSGGPKNMAEFNDYNRQSVAYAGQIVRDHPKDPRVPRAYYLRAKAYKDLGAGSIAIADYKTVSDKYPQSPEWGLATMAVAELLIATREYPTAIRYLNRLAVNRSSKFYAMSIDRLAWCYYYLNDINTALKYVNLELDYFQSIMDQDTPEGRTASTEREKALATAVVFYSQGFGTKRPGFEISKVLPYFKSLKPGNFLGKMSEQFALFLRSKGFDGELETFATLVQSENLAVDSATEIRINAFENQTNKRRYLQMRRSGEDLIKFLQTKNTTPDGVEAPHFAKARKNLANAVSMLQENLSKSKNPTEINEIGQTLHVLYNAMIVASGNDLAGLMKLHFNLAETDTLLKNFDSASVQYRWVVDHGPPRNEQEKNLIEEARLKAIHSRYESLRAANQIQTNLKAKSPVGVEKKTPSPAVVEWVRWIDEFPVNSKKNADLHVYRFESNRLIYSYGHIDEAMKRLTSFAKTYPDSNLAIPSASLVVDTVIAAEDWDRTIAVANDFLGVTKWKGTSFYSSLRKIAGDAHYKLVEKTYKAKDYPGAIAKAEEFQKYFPENTHQTDAQTLIANAALALNQKDKAIAYFDKLKQSKSLKSEMSGTYLLTRGSMAEDKYDFKDAAMNYRDFLALPSSAQGMSAADVETLTQKTFLMAWLSGDWALTEHVFKTGNVCKGDRKVSCDDVRAYHRLQTVTKKDLNDQKFVKHAYFVATGTGGAWEVGASTAKGRLAWAAIAMKGMNHLYLEQKLNLIKFVSATWPKVEPLFALQVLSHFSQSIPETLVSCRKQVKDLAHLRIDKNAIAKRTQLVEQMEKAAGTLADVHWARLRVAALGEVSLLYRDFADEVAKLPVPKGLSDEDLKAFKGMVEETRAPFVKRFEELRGKALELAAETGVDDDQMNALVSDAEWVAIKTPRLEASFLDSLDPKYTWTEPVPHALRVAIAAENWPLALFLAGEGEEKKSLTPRQARAARALFYSHAGAAAEALAEVTKVAEELNEQSRPRAFAYMIPRYYKVHQKDKVASYLNEFVKLDGYKQGVTGVGETAVRALVGAANWAQVSVPGSFEASLMQQARGGGR